MFVKAVLAGVVWAFGVGLVPAEAMLGDPSWSALAGPGLAVAFLPAAWALARPWRMRRRAVVPARVNGIMELGGVGGAGRRGWPGRRYYP